MSAILDGYSGVAGAEVVDQLRQLGKRLRGAKVVHVNSTRLGGGVAEILGWLVPLMREVGIDAHWEVIEGNEDFYECTKSFHNALQGQAIPIAPAKLRVYEETNAVTAERLRSRLEDADFVFVHDPQPARLLQNVPDRKGKWVWRCHIDVSHPDPTAWDYVREIVKEYDASIFSLADFAQILPHPTYLIAPSIDPHSDKNRDLPGTEIDSVLQEFDIDPARPYVLQVSRFDRFKDPVGVVKAFRITREYVPGVQLVLAGGTATDDPEGEAVLAEVRAAAGDDPDVFLLLLPPDAHRTINALQRRAAVVLQKSIREGFGLTVAEAMWKSQPVIGGDTGGIRLQVVNRHTGFLVNTPEGAALRIRYLLRNQAERREMGRKAREFVRENFLLTRHLREYLTLMVGLQHGDADRIEMNGIGALA